MIFALLLLALVAWPGVGWGQVAEADWATLERVGQAIWANTLASDADPTVNPFAKRIIDPPTAH